MGGGHAAHSWTTGGTAMILHPCAVASFIYAMMAWLQEGATNAQGTMCRVYQCPGDKTDRQTVVLRY